MPENIDENNNCKDWEEKEYSKSKSISQLEADFPLVMNPTPLFRRPMPNRTILYII
jgi:hypothetical protein